MTCSCFCHEPDAAKPFPGHPDGCPCEAGRVSSSAPTLYVAPISAADADAFVVKLHRHNGPTGPRSIFATSVVDDTGTVRGVAIVGRPVARMLVDGWTAEVQRTCTDGVENANSMLYGACWRAARALGYRRLITYTQHSETGASLRAAGFVQVASMRPTKGWSRPSRQRDNDAYDSTARWRWEIATESCPPWKPQRVVVTEEQPDLFGERRGDDPRQGVVSSRGRC